MNNNPLEQQKSLRKLQLQHINEDFPSYDQLSVTENPITVQNKPMTTLNVGSVREKLKDMADDYGVDEVVMRSRPSQTELSNTTMLANKASDQVRLGFNARNAANLRTNSYSSTQDLRPSSMTNVSSAPNSSSRLRDIRKSLIAETKTLPTLRPLTAGRPISASMINLSRISSLDFGAHESGRFSSSTYGPRETKTDYPKTRQKNGSPFQVDVLKGIAGIGIKVQVTPNGYAQITDIQRGGPVDKNGQVRVGDNILFVNTTELTGHTDARVQQVLRLLPRGLTKLVISGVAPSEYQTQTNDQDKFTTSHTQQRIQKQSEPQSSTVSEEQFSLHPNGNSALQNKTSLPRFVPSPTVATAVNTNSSIDIAYSNEIETTPAKHLEDSNHMTNISSPRHEMLPVETVHGISLKETGEIRSYGSTGQDEKQISNTRIVEMTTMQAGIPLPNQDNMTTSSHNPEIDTSLSMSGTRTDATSHSVVLSKSIGVGEHFNEDTFKDDSDTWYHPLPRSKLVSDNIGHSTLSPHKIDSSPFSSDNIDNSIFLFDNTDQSSLIPKTNADSTLSFDIVKQSTFSSNNASESTILSNSTDQSTSSLYNFDQSTLSSNSPDQFKLMSNNIVERAKNTDQNATNILPLTANELPLNSASASEIELHNFESPQLAIVPPIEHTPKLYRGRLVTLVDSVDGKETTQTRPELRIQTDNERQLTKPTTAESSRISDHRKTSVSVTPTENYAKVNHNNSSPEQPVPKKRTSLIQNVGTDKTKVINKSLMPLHERRNNTSATLPRVPTSHPVTSPLYASKSLSVSTPALNTRKISSLEPSPRSNENISYQKISDLSPTPETTIDDFSLDSDSHSRISPRYASKSISLSNLTVSPPKINVLEHSSRVSERANYHSMAVLSPAPLNSALSPRRTPSFSSQNPVFVYPTQHTPTNKDAPSGRLSGGKNRTLEHPHARKTIKSQLYKAVHPDIYKSASVTLLDKELISTEHESFYRKQSYDNSHQPQRKSSPSSNEDTFSVFNTEVKNEDSENTLQKFDTDHKSHPKSFPSTSDHGLNYDDAATKSRRSFSTHVTTDRDQNDDVSNKLHKQSSTSSGQTHLSSFDTEATNEGSEHAVTRFDDVFGSFPENKAASAEDIFLCSTVNEGVSSTNTEDIRAIDNVLLHVREVKRPVAPARIPRKSNIKEIRTDIEANQSVNTNIQSADIGLQEQMQDSKLHIIVNQTSDNLSSETPISNDLTINMLQEKLLTSNEQHVTGIHGECGKETHVFHQHENESKHSVNSLDEYDKLRQHSYNIPNTSYSHVDGIPSNINQNVSTNSDNPQQDQPDNRDVPLRTQCVLEEIGGTAATRVAQSVNDIVTVNNFTDNRISTMNGVFDDDTNGNSLQDDILVQEAARIVNNVMMTIKNNYSIFFPNEEVNYGKPLTSESAEDEPPPLPDTPPPPLPDAPPPSLFIEGSTEHWREQNNANVKQKTSIENNVEKQEDQALSMPKYSTVESTAVQLETIAHTEFTVADLPDIPREGQSKKTISSEPRISHADIYHVREENRVNSPSPVDILSEDSGMPPDEDQELATDDTTSTPGELADNTFGLDSLKHVPCPSDIEAGLFSSVHEDSNQLLPTLVQETSHFVMGPDNDLKIQFYDMSQQSVEALDVFSEDNITRSNLTPPISPVSTLRIAASSAISVEKPITQNSTILQGTDFHLPTPQNTLLATDISHFEKQEVLPLLRMNEEKQEFMSPPSDNSPDSADVSRDISVSNLGVNVSEVHVSESSQNIAGTVISNRRWCLRSNTSTCPVLAAEAGVSVRASYSQTSLMKLLPPESFVRLVERANAVLDTASASTDLTLLFVHLHRDIYSVPLGVDLKHEGGIWFRVSEIKTGSPVWKENGAAVGDWLLAVDSLWCDNVTVMRFLSRLAKPKHDSLLVLCRQHTDVDKTDSRLDEVNLPAMKHQILVHEREHKHSVPSQECDTHSHFSGTTEVSQANPISMEVKTTQDQQLLLSDCEALDSKQSLPLTSLTEKTREFLEQTPPLLEDTFFVGQKSTLSELALSPPGQTPPLPAQGPPLQSQISHFQEADSSLQRGASRIQRKDRPFHEEAPDLPEDDLPPQGQAQLLSGQGQSPQGQVSPPLPGRVLLTPSIDHTSLISSETTPFQEQNLSHLQQVPPVSQNNGASPRINYQLQSVQSEQTSQVSIRAAGMQEESVHPPTFQERSTRYKLQQNRVSNIVSSSENVNKGRLTTRITRRFSEEQSHPELRTDQRHEYFKTASRSMSEVLTVPTQIEAHTGEKLTSVANSSESTAGLGVGVFKVAITKGAAGVGFSLEGGVESRRGDLPITIKRIFKGGPAEKSGLLKVNDEILEVNGLEFSKMRRYEAWNHLKSLDDGEITMTIRRM